MNEWRTKPHRRFNPLSGEWMLVSPHRLQRPWQGAVAAPALAMRPSYDPQCYLCPGNTRAAGVRNPHYEDTYVFDNDYPALLMDTPPLEFSDGVLRAEAEVGRCRVVCFSPRHDLDIASMEWPQIASVVNAWCEQYVQLGATPEINAITIFENRGAMMGASNPHPHGQIWAQRTLPNELVKESANQRDYLASTGTCLLCAYVEQELGAQERIVYVNDDVAVIVPFWAVWPFEVLVVPRRHVASIDLLESEERGGLARGLQQVTSRYDRLFDAPFPYTMGFHQQPTDGAPYPEWHAHAHYYPPLLRSASVRKFMVGYEMLAQPQRDITPENAAERLREVAGGPPQ
jgi:UDPglucose--hexose-1-phosphate uridylyltransferase